MRLSSHRKTSTPTGSVRGFVGRLARFSSASSARWRGIFGDGGAGGYIGGKALARVNDARGRS